MPRSEFTSFLKNTYLALALLALTLGAPSSTFGQSCPSGSNVVVSANCSSQINIASNPATVTVNNGVSVSVTSTDGLTNKFGIYNNGGSITSLTNNGIISSSTIVSTNDIGFGIKSAGDIGTLTNTGTISGTGDVNKVAGYGISQNSGTITTLNNGGTITGSGYGILLGGSVVTLNNNGTIHGGADGIIGGGSITNFTNSGSVNAGINAIYLTGSISNLANTSSGVISGGAGLYNSGTIDSFTNQGAINGNASGYAALYNAGGTIGTLTNQGQIKIDTGGTGDPLGAIVNTGSITTVNNATGSTIAAIGTLGGGAAGIYNNGGVITSLSNNGSISGADYGINNTGIITNLNNSGSIAGGTNDIKNGSADLTPFQTNTTVINSGGQTFTITQNGASSPSATWPPGSNGTISWGTGSSIVNLNNSQGGGTPLKYTGFLPQNYGIILGSSASNYGKLQASNILNWNTQIGTYSYYDPVPDETYTYSALNLGTGTTSFSIYSGPVKSARYLAVISGITSSYLTPSTLTGNYTNGGNTYAYQLVLESGSTDIWDLLFPSYVAGPTVADTQQSISSTAKVLQGTLTLLNTTLVNSFTYDCNEFGANNVCISAGGRNTAVSALNGLNNTSALLIAAFRPHPNYRIGAYADQNLSLNNAGSTVNLGNNTPLVGVFGAWNERLDGTSSEVKVSAAYGQKNATVTRQVVGTSEAGSGGAPINSQGAQVTGKYGFGIMKDAIVSPYVGVRFTQNNMNGYTEASSSSVTTPLTYNALNTNTTTLLAGIGASYRVIPQATLFASAGIESDTNANNGTYQATGLSGLTAVNFNSNPVKNRATATLGAYYDIERNQRLGITGIYRQEPYQAVQTTTVMATYTVGL